MFQWLVFLFQQLTGSMNAKEANQLLNVGVHEAAEFQASARVSDFTILLVKAEQDCWDQSPLSSISLSDWKVDAQDATTYDRTEVIVSWEKQMERIVASERLKCFLCPPPYVPISLPFFPSFLPCFLPPSFFPSFHHSVTDSVSLCILVPSQNNLGKKCPANRSSENSLSVTMEWKWYWGKWTSGQKDRLVSTSELTPWRWCSCAWKGSSLCPVSVRKRLITNHCFLRRWESSRARGWGAVVEEDPTPLVGLRFSGYRSGCWSQAAWTHIPNWYFLVVSLWASHLHFSVPRVVCLPRALSVLWSF